jgi:alkanesulfonate monooxygenase SsuD/methylene tetrahydromethanopterin reductase-like flavin-dependent oxidoreductase (luciferase family)
MRVCLMIEGQEGVTWDQWRALAETAEANGFEALFRSDHYESLDGPPNRGSLDAWGTINALAVLTTTLKLGTLVSPVTFRQPAVLANGSITAHEVSGGRVSLGMGAGWMEAEHEVFGFPFPPMSERVRMLSEQVEAVQGYWGDRPRPHLIIGGSGRSGTIDPAAKWADEYNIVMATPAECVERRDKLARACEREGREAIPFSLMTGCAIGRDPDEARERIRRRLGRAGQQLDPAEYKRQRGEAAILGTLDEAAERLRAYEQAGVERVMLQHFDHSDLEMVELIGRELATAVA